MTCIEVVEYSKWSKLGWVTLARNHPVDDDPLAETDRITEKCLVFLSINME